MLSQAPKNLLRNFAIIMAVLAMALPAGAQPGPRDGFGGPGQGMGRGFRGGRGGALLDRPDGPRQGAGLRTLDVHRGGRGGFGGGFYGRILLSPQVRQKLNITDDQAKKIEDSLYNTEKQTIEVDARLKTAELDLSQAMKQKRPDRNQVLSQVDAVTRARADRAKLQVTEKLNVRDILTDQQLDTIEKYIQEHRGPGMRGRGGPGFGRGGFGRGGFGRGGFGFGQGGPGMGGPGMSGPGMSGPGMGGRGMGGFGAGRFGGPAERTRMQNIGHPAAEPGPQDELAPLVALLEPDDPDMAAPVMEAFGPGEGRLDFAPPEAQPMPVLTPAAPAQK